jgi:hypothetical protein
MLWRKRHKSTFTTTCKAVVGWSTRCPKPAIPGSELCTFHAGLLGPWAEAVRPIATLRQEQKTRRR